MQCSRIDCFIEFSQAKLSQKYCSSKCRRVAATRRNNLTDKRKVSKKRYQQSGKNVKVRNKHQQSDKFKAARSRYLKSKKGKAASRRDVVKYRNTDKGKQASRRASALARLRHPDKIRARAAVGSAKKAKTLISPNLCARCGKFGQTVAHHHRGYEEKYWLDIVWLCSSCHSNEHAEDKKLVGESDAEAPS